MALAQFKGCSTSEEHQNKGPVQTRFPLCCLLLEETPEGGNYASIIIFAPPSASVSESHSLVYSSSLPHATQCSDVTLAESVQVTRLGIQYGQKTDFFSTSFWMCQSKTQQSF